MFYEDCHLYYFLLYCTCDFSRSHFYLFLLFIFSTKGILLTLVYLNRSWNSFSFNCEKEELYLCTRLIISSKLLTILTNYRYQWLLLIVLDFDGPQIKVLIAGSFFLACSTNQLVQVAFSSATSQNGKTYMLILILIYTAMVKKKMYLYRAVLNSTKIFHTKGIQGQS